MLSLVWFRRDLRVHDHPALTRAAAEGAALPVYVAEPEAWALPEASGRHWAFLDESLRALREDLARCGQPLILRSGDAVEVLARLHAKHRFTRIATHPETGNVWARARFQRVADWAQGRGIDWLVLDEGPALPPPALAPVAEGTGALPGPRALGLAEDRCPYRQPGGHAAAALRLDGGVARPGSRLSPYFAFGVLSARPEGALRRPLAARAAAHAAPLAQPSGRPDQGPWARGETGLPIVDAAMRALQAGGWLEARMRGLLASVGLHLMGLDRAAVGLHLARLSTDHDPAILWHEIARVAAGPVADPLALGRRLDPDGTFLRRWLADLAPVPAAYLHAPWLWPEARRRLAGRYPEPVLDPAQALREARADRARRLPPRPRRAPDPLIEGPPRPRGPQMALDL